MSAVSFLLPALGVLSTEVGDDVENSGVGTLRVILQNAHIDILQREREAISDLMLYALCYRRSCGKRQSVVIRGSPARGRHSPAGPGEDAKNPVGQQVLPFHLSCSASCVLKAEVKWRLDNDHK